MHDSTEGGLRTPYERQPAEAWQPRYTFTPRSVGYLACGELAVEPVLGPVRVSAVRPNEEETVDAEFVHVRWRDEHGPGIATGRYPAERSFLVRMPAPEDRLLIRQGIDQARWRKQEITGDTARLIAAHLHTGPKSALHGFMVDGRVEERLYDELETVAGQRHYAREWLDALARYCLARDDPGPIMAWARRKVSEGEARADEWLTAAGVDAEALVEHVNGNGSEHPEVYPGLLTEEHVPSRMAAQLIEAAFMLGVEAVRFPARSAGARWLTRQRVRRQPA